MIAIGVVFAGTHEAKALIDRWTTAADRAAAARPDSLLARAALWAVMDRTVGDGGWSLCRDARGKPFLATADGAAGPFVSLSHSRGLVACAVTWAGQVGIDVERHRRRDFSALAGHAFGPRECAEAAREGEAGFFRIWTLREAMAKATGAGLAMVADRQDRADGAPRRGCWTVPGWRLLVAQPQPDCSLAVAVDTGRTTPDISPNWIDLAGG